MLPTGQGQNHGQDKTKTVPDPLYAVNIFTLDANASPKFKYYL